MRPFALALLGVLLWACQSGAPIGTTCERTSECATPLVCRIGRCRTECVVARDCPAGQACLVNADGLGACELPAIDVCSASCDAPLICASGHCRVECTVDTDCPGGHVCVSRACQRADVAMDAGVSDAGDDAGTIDAATPIVDAAPPDHGDTGLSCDPVAETGCGAGERCSVGTGAPACVASTGTLRLGDACTDDAQCEGRLSCQGGRCVRVCLLGDTTFCGADLACSVDSVHGQVSLAAAEGVGLCTQTCDLLTDSGCTNGGSCALGTAAGGDFTWCRDVHAAGAGQSCSRQFDCAAGLYCHADALCHHFCDPMNATTTCPTGTCTPITSFRTQPQVGVCVP